MLDPNALNGQPANVPAVATNPLTNPGLMLGMSLLSAGGRGLSPAQSAQMMQQGFAQYSQAQQAQAAYALELQKFKLLQQENDRQQKLFEGQMAGGKGTASALQNLINSHSHLASNPALGGTPVTDNPNSPLYVPPVQTNDIPAEQKARYEAGISLAENGQNTLALETLPEQARSFSLSPGQTQYDAMGNPVAAVANYPLVFQTQNELAKEHDELSKDFVTASAAYGKFNDTINAKGINTSPQLQRDAVIASIRLADPRIRLNGQSVEDVAELRGVDQRIQAAYDKLSTGQILTAKQIQDLKNATSTNYSSLDRTQTNIDNQIAARAAQYGIPASNVVINHHLPGFTPNPAPGSPRNRVFNPTTGRIE